MQCAANDVQQLPRRRRRRGRREGRDEQGTSQVFHKDAQSFTDAVMTRPEGCVDAVPLTKRQIRNLVYGLRHLSLALQRTCGPLSTGIFRAVRSFLQDRLTTHASSAAPLRRTVRLVGLGIGRFDPREHRAGFMQMATLLALRDMCAEVVNKVNAQSTSVEHRQHGSRGGALRVHTVFFDPVVEPLHVACCAALDVEAEQVNRHGAYCLAADDAVLILYMPHCPWALLHNAVAANWPMSQCKAADCTCVDAFRRLFFIANDPRDAMLCDSKRGHNALRTDLLACWSVQSIGFDKRGRSGTGMHATSVDEEDDSNAVTVGAQGAANTMYCTQELRRAFAYMAAFGADPTLEASLLQQRLHTLARTPPVIIKPTTKRGGRPMYSELL